MKSTKSYTIHPKHLRNARALRRSQAADSAPPTVSPPASTVRTTPRDFANPVDYQHPYESMGRFAQALALRYDANRTRHAYYRQLRLLHEHFALDPALLTESHLRDYFLFVKLQKHWKPKSIRLALAAIQQFFVGLLGHADWKIFRQIRTKDHDVLPPVLTRPEVHALLAHIRLRRYRTPIKLIYACGLRLSECLALTIHDIKGAENKLLIRNSKGHRDRVLPLPTCLYEELRRYWKFHRHPLLIFPNVGRGEHTPEATARRMHEATAPMPCSSLQRLIVVARKELNLPAASVHTLRHSFATHMLEVGAHLHTIQKLLGHQQITSTMVYLHLTHQTTREALGLMEELCRTLPR
ncbi:MAG: tyrosine-type recombinase/integrase [Verrucomicrobiales bacterium]|nr:tyrosine-type recombinase/integrase [Verrucomicrobiales bacterium]